MKQVFASGKISHEPIITARTAGVAEDEITTALGMATYTPPPRGDLERPLPIRLAFLKSSNNSRVLTHVAPGLEGYVSHTLLNVPPSADAQLAIQTWGSPLWQRVEPEAGDDLPELPYLPVAELLDDTILVNWLADAEHCDLLRYALQALVVNTEGRVFLVASADDVAQVVYAITRVLPPNLLDEFTFSTYEPEPLTCQARLVGCETPGLPEACYLPPHTGYDPVACRQTSLGEPSPFVDFAVSALASGDHARLDALRSTWQQLGLADPRRLDLVYRLHDGQGLKDANEAAEALTHPALTAWMVGSAPTMEQLLGWALEDRDFAQHSFSRALQALRQKSSALAQLAQTVRSKGFEALQAGNVERTATALEVVLPMVAPAKAAGIWGELLTQIPQPDALPWSMRWYLLPRLARYKQTSNGVTDEALAEWLSVPTEHFSDLLTLDLPRNLTVAAGRAILARSEEPTPEFARACAGHLRLTMTLLTPTGESGAEREKAIALFSTLLQEAPGIPWFEEVLQAELPPETRNAYFEAALGAEAIVAERIIRHHGPSLLTHFAGQSGLDRLGRQFLAAPPDDLLESPEYLTFLQGLQSDSGTSVELRARIDSVLTIHHYLETPSFDRDQMTLVADALLVSPPVVPNTARGTVFTAVARQLQKRSLIGPVHQDLEAVVLTLGQALATDSTDLFENLLREIRGRSDMGRNPYLVQAFLALALQATESRELADQLQGLDGHAFALAQDAARHGGRTMLAGIDEMSISWPGHARSKWAFLHQAVRPQGFKRTLRDAVAFVIGAVIALGGWWIWRQVD